MNDIVYTTECDVCGESILTDGYGGLVDDECSCDACPHDCCNPFMVEDGPLPLHFEE